MEAEEPWTVWSASVGFGKTEVALRAAFKAVMDGKRLPFFVQPPFFANSISIHPRTVIDFPITLDMLSRFERADNKVKSWRRGMGFLDLVVGTHRLSVTTQLQGFGSAGYRRRAKIWSAGQGSDQNLRRALRSHSSSNAIPRTLYLPWWARSLSAIETLSRQSLANTNRSPPQIG